MTDSEILTKAADQVTQILRIPHTHINITKFVVLYSLLFVVTGGDEEIMRHWLNTYNKHLGFFPAARLTDERSLDKIIAYLESMSV